MKVLIVKPVGLASVVRPTDFIDLLRNNKWFIFIYFHKLFQKIMMMYPGWTRACIDWSESRLVDYFDHKSALSDAIEYLSAQ